MSAAAAPPFIADTRHCAACWYDLKGLPLRGRCPECGAAYDREQQAEDAARNARALARQPTESQAFMDWCRRYCPSLWTLAILLLVIGGAAIVMGLGAMALQKFRNIVDPPCVCNGGGGGYPA